MVLWMDSKALSLGGALSISGKGVSPSSTDTMALVDSRMQVKLYPGGEGGGRGGGGGERGGGGREGR